MLINCSHKEKNKQQTNQQNKKRKIKNIKPQKILRLTVNLFL